jgi:hypothetical protein
MADIASYVDGDSNVRRLLWDFGIVYRQPVERRSGGWERLDAAGPGAFSVRTMSLVAVRSSGP